MIWLRPWQEVQTFWTSSLPLPSPGSVGAGAVWATTGITAQADTASIILSLDMVDIWGSPPSRGRAIGPARLNYKLGGLGPGVNCPLSRSSRRALLHCSMSCRVQSGACLEFESGSQDGKVNFEDFADEYRSHFLRVHCDFRWKKSFPQN